MRGDVVFSQLSVLVSCLGPIRQALQLVRNELPSSVFQPESSTRLFKLAICSPCDMRFAPESWPISPSTKCAVASRRGNLIASCQAYALSRDRLCDRLRAFLMNKVFRSTGSSKINWWLWRQKAIPYPRRGDGGAITK